VVLELQGKELVVVQVTMANTVVAVAVVQVDQVIQTQVVVAMEQVHIQLG
jgi:hypothetical protein